MSQQPPYGQPPGNQGPPPGSPYPSGPPQGPPPSWQPPQQPWPPQQGPPPYPPPPYQQQYQQAPYPPPYYGPPPTQRRSGVLGGIGIGCLIAAALVVIGIVIIVAFVAAFAHRASSVIATVGNVPVSRAATAGISAGTTSSPADVRVALANGSVATVTTVEQEQKTHRVTITAISDNAKSTNPSEQPHAGNRYYILHVTIANVGTSDINAGPWTLRTADGQEFNQSIVPGIGDPPDSSSLAPGGTTAGYIIFEIPATAKVQWVHYDPNPYVKGELYFDA